MSSVSSPGGGGGGGLDFELNLASIIDCFTVLITFMLASATFLSIGVLDAGIAAGGAEAASQQPPPVNITIELRKDMSVSVKVSGKENRSQTITAKNGGRDLESLVSQLGAVKSRWSSVNAAILQAENGVEYGELVKTMEAVRKNMPAVMLGGF
ncbi:MAG: hypothetical protein A2583_09840 [Bdellovibrionales bacterium RIFOXYD1_FULL_53_11]|nr:MAG: hypothetical protein A2583_09840 [Bdellovibrionales bacterium RIFOXYD1_FULL_53_11]